MSEWVSLYSNTVLVVCSCVHKVVLLSFWSLSQASVPWKIFLDTEENEETSEQWEVSPQGLLSSSLPVSLKALDGNLTSNARINTQSHLLT